MFYLFLQIRYLFTRKRGFVPTSALCLSCTIAVAKENHRFLALCSVIADGIFLIPVKMTNHAAMADFPCFSRALLRQLCSVCCAVPGLVTQCLAV